jgi:predicted ABC-class ATPase
VADADDLKRILRHIDGRGYKAYRELRGRFDLDGCELHVDHVQGDPFAAPSRMRLRVDAETAAFPAELSRSRARCIALADYLARRARRAGAARGHRRGSGHSGEIHVDAGGQQVIERSSVRLAADWVELRLEVGLPAAGRRILGDVAAEILCGDLPEIAAESLRWETTPQAEATRFVEQIENQEQLREELVRRGLVAFVGDGAILPRESGASDLPLAGDAAVPFRSPESLRVRLPLANPDAAAGGLRREITGMGIGAGVTLVVGGGYHGKSTLLRALERAVHPHIPGDGREWVVSRRDLVKIRAEDGRRVEQVDISAFVGDLPRGRATDRFCSDDASGSTSQAANIAEAIEVGAGGLLLDEDTCATNFMVRDARMQALVEHRFEPITPFLDRVREIFEDHGVSTVLVMGGCGDYFDVADRVLALRDFTPHDVTDRARRVAAEHPTGRRPEARPGRLQRGRRCPDARSFDASRGRREVVIDASGTDAIRFGRELIDLRQVDQQVDASQTRAIGCAIHYAARHLMGTGMTLAEVLDALETVLDREGLDVLDPRHRPGRHPGPLGRPRRFEIAAAVNRLRSLRAPWPPGG